MFTEVVFFLVRAN